MSLTLLTSSKCAPQPPRASVTASFGAISRDITIIATGTALIQSSRTGVSRWLERDDFSSNRHRALSFYLSMIFSENRYPLFRIML